MDWRCIDPRNAGAGLFLAEMITKRLPTHFLTCLVRCHVSLKRREVIIIAVRAINACASDKKRGGQYGTPYHRSVLSLLLAKPFSFTLEDYWNFLVEPLALWLPAQHLLCSFTFTLRVQSPADGLEVCLLQCFLPA